MFSAKLNVKCWLIKIIKNIIQNGKYYCNGDAAKTIVKFVSNV